MAESDLTFIFSWYNWPYYLSHAQGLKQILFYSLSIFIERAMKIIVLETNVLQVFFDTVPKIMCTEIHSPYMPNAETTAQVASDIEAEVPGHKNK